MRIRKKQLFGERQAGRSGPEVVVASREVEGEKKAEKNFSKNSYPLRVNRLLRLTAPPIPIQTAATYDVLLVSEINTYKSLHSLTSNVEAFLGRLQLIIHWRPSKTGLFAGLF